MGKNIIQKILDFFKNYKNVAILMAIVFLGSIATICFDKKNVVTPENSMTSNEFETKTNNNIVKEESSGSIMPFVDMASWVNSSSKYYLNGTVDLGVVYDEVGCENFCLGFIRPDDRVPLESNGTIRWGWGGYFKMSERGNDGFQYEGIKKSIKNIRDKGGEVVVSVGGQLGKAPWVVTQNVNNLYNMYSEIVSAYNLKRLDLDIEESNQGHEQNVANAKAIKRLQDKTGVEIVLTIPVMPYGYTNTQKNLIRAYLNNGVEISTINNMTMCYGDEVYENEDFADASIRAIDSSASQIVSLYNEYGISKTIEEVYKMLGATVDIGYENQYNPIFTTEMTERVANYAKQKKLSMFSFWCINRDILIEKNSAIDEKYGFYEASTKFL